MLIARAALAFMIVTASASSAQAQSAPQAPRAPLLDRLAGCRAVADPAARLSCFDEATAALDAAERTGDLIVVDRNQIDTARRQLFGIDIPSFAPFLNRGGQPAALNAIETTLADASRGGDGRWVFTLADETVWRQTDAEALYVRDQPGQPVRVRRAAIGSYLLTVGNGRAVRVRRQTE